MQAELASFVDVTNLEEEIEKSLNLRVNHNFAIDIEGNRYIELPDGSTEVKDSAQAPAKDPDLQQPQTQT